MRPIEDARHDRAIGLLCLTVTAVGWGLNWTALKFLLREWSPLTARGAAGVAAGLGLAALALLRGERLQVPRTAWPRLAAAALFNVSGWMGLSSVALLWLSAGEGATVAYTMPIWAALLAAPVLGERLTLLRMLALGLGLAGLGVLFGGGVDFAAPKLPGLACALGAAFSFALGTVVTKRAPLALPPLVTAAWQVGLGCGVLLLIGLVIEPAPGGALSLKAWGAVLYMTCIPLAVCYLTWFAALRRLPAGVAALGTMLAPAVGVLTGAALLGETVGIQQIAGLGLTLTGIVLAVRG